MILVPTSTHFKGNVIGYQIILKCVFLLYKPYLDFLLKGGKKACECKAPAQCVCARATLERVNEQIRSV